MAGPFEIIDEHSVRFPESEVVLRRTSRAKYRARNSCHECHAFDAAKLAIAME